MARNIEMNYKKEDGSYEVLYPVTTRGNVGGILLPELTVVTDNGATVKAINSGFEVEAVASQGQAVLDLPAYGDWDIQVTTSNGGGKGSFNVDTVKQYSMTLQSYILTVNTQTGATVTVQNEGENYSLIATGGVATFNLVTTGTWNVSSAFYGITLTGEIEADGAAKSINLQPSFSSLSWSQIDTVIQNGGIGIFSVGNSKAIRLTGSAGDINFSNTQVYAVIIGINHNSSREGNNRLHLQLSTNSENTGLLGYEQMNTRESNRGGWGESQMRTAICVGIYNAFPSDLKTIVKSTTKWTSAGALSTSITSTSDNVFLLSEFEASGNIRYSVQEEQNYQQEYDWYKSNSQLKFMNESETMWWYRSPDATDYEFFCGVSADGSNYHSRANEYRGVAPCFCI